MPRKLESTVINIIFYKYRHSLIGFSDYISIVMFRLVVIALILIKATASNTTEPELPPTDDQWLCSPGYCSAGSLGCWVCQPGNTFSEYIIYISLFYFIWKISNISVLGTYSDSNKVPCGK